MSLSAETTLARPKASTDAAEPILTQRDLARAAGVSMTTVYNALHRRSLVSERTREKIFNLIRKHDYTPNAVARSMVRQKTEVLGIVVPSLEIVYYARLISAIERFANAAGYHSIICQHLDDPHKEEREVTMLRQRRVDGLIIRNCGKAVDIGFFHRLVAAKMPLVLLGGRTEGLDEAFVGTDDRHDSLAAVEWLISRGHRRIAHLSWYRRPNHEEGPRFQGYCEALKKHGIPYDPALVEPCQTEYQSGRLEILNVLRRTAHNPPTAAFAVNDNTAVGVIAGAREAGFRVPDDFSVVGYGGYLDPAVMPVQLTTISESIEEIARRASEMLIDQIEQRSTIKGPVLVQGHLHIGQSA